MNSMPNAFRGPLSMILATGSYLVNDTMMKLATSGLPTYEVLFLRGAAATLWGIPLLLLLGYGRQIPLLFDRRGLQRNVFELAAIPCYVGALANMQIAGSTAPGQTTPPPTPGGASFFSGGRDGGGCACPCPIRAGDWHDGLSGRRSVDGDQFDRECQGFAGKRMIGVEAHRVVGKSRDDERHLASVAARRGQAHAEPEFKLRRKLCTRNILHKPGIMLSIGFRGRDRERLAVADPHADHRVLEAGNDGCGADREFDGGALPARVENGAVAQCAGVMHLHGIAAGCCHLCAFLRVNAACRRADV